MRPLLDHLEALPYPTLLYSTSSLDIYFGKPESSTLYVYTEGDLIELVKVFSNLEYPGTSFADAMLTAEEGTVMFKTVEDIAKPPQLPFAPSNLYYAPKGKKYVDPYGVYPEVRNRRLVFAESDSSDGMIVRDWRMFADTAVLLSRYDFDVDEVSEELVDTAAHADLERVLQPDGPESQRRLLVELFESRNPKAGLRFLRRVGYIDVHWNDLSAMYNVSHTKDHHPEGNVWEHTLETFRYRKDTNLALSLGLLFHDAGKPYALPNEGRLFDRHSQIGAQIASRFLRRLGFSERLVGNVLFLVREHMLPGFLHRLPTYRTERVMGSELFPLLLELYRCDLSSTYRGPSGYYRACKVYRSYLKNVRNPFRTSDGKKILRRYVER